MLQVLRRFPGACAILWAAICAATTAAQDLPLVVLDREDIEIRSSVLVRIPKGLVLRDVRGDGVIRIAADGITVRFETGSVLLGSAANEPAESRHGIGVKLDGRSKVVLEGLAIEGYRIGVEASNAPGLRISNGSIRRGFQQRLGSTPEKEDGADWLSPHDNDAGEWAARYGAGLRLLECNDVVVHDMVVRDCQNGLLLERSRRARIYDVDMSFLSGWGLALWRIEDSIISRNAFDFCVRGYSHGVYNRGQDSAGILMFEQCRGNAFVENSITHGGDGIFGFAGREALSGAEPRGCNDNLFQGNDLSYAAAHGLEMTFSFRNQVLANRFVGNAICGIWGGYSQDSWIAGNSFEDNGELGYGLERGGVNIEHGYRNRVVGNRFRSNRCGVHFWWDPDPSLLQSTWGRANERGSTENLVQGNSFDRDQVGVHLRAAQSTFVADNRHQDVPEELARDAESKVVTEFLAPEAPNPISFTVLGKRTPVGARARLAGRENIILTEYGPWDHESSLLQCLSRGAGEHVYEARRFQGELDVRLEGSHVRASLLPGPVGKVTVTATREGVFPYTLTVEGSDGVSRSVTAVLSNVRWEVTSFPWTKDPRESPASFAADAAGARAVRTHTVGLDLRYGGGGPSDVECLGSAVGAASLPRDRFGTRATTKVRWPKGEYQLTTLSDDGIRVWVDGSLLIDDWTWHGPTAHDATFLVAAAETEITVEHFELDGHAVLTVEIFPKAP